MKAIRGVAAAFAMVFAAGCATRAPRPEFAGQRTAETVVVEVENLNYADVVVYAMPDGAWERIGEVTGLSSATLELPARLSTAAVGFRLLVSAIGSRAAYLSGHISAIPGDVVELRVSPVLNMSSWSIHQ